MYTYKIRKTSNGEFKEIEKKFKLNVNKFVKRPDTLYFDVEGQDVPYLLDMAVFSRIMISQIEQGLMEQLEYQDGIIKTTVRDGNTIRTYTYDFSWNDFDNVLNHSNLDELKREIYRIVSIFNEDPNKWSTSERKYLNMIYDIIDGDRLPILNNEEELLRIFEVYNDHKEDILDELLNHVVFYDADGNVVDFTPFIHRAKLETIRYDVLTQMEAAMLIFIEQNNAHELYQNYMSQLFIPTREIQYAYIDENGNEVILPKEEERSIIDVGKEFVFSKLNKASKAAKRVRAKIQKK